MGSCCEDHSSEVRCLVMRAELLEYAHPCVCFKCPRVRRQAQGAAGSAQGVESRDR